MKWKGLSNPQNVIWRIPYSETWHGKISEQWWQTEGSKTFRVARPTVIVRQMANSELKIVIIADNNASSWEEMKKCFWHIERKGF